MSARPPRRRRVEIYFILYLVALVLVMPETKETDAIHADHVAIAAARLDLAPDRTKLVCRMMRDSGSTYYITHLDSVNTIRYSGSVNSVSVSARIEELESGQVITIHPNQSPTPMFALEHQPLRNAIVFRWNPMIPDGVVRNFRVTILSSGSPSGSEGANSGPAEAIPEGLRVIGSTQFVLSAVLESENTQPIVTVVGRTDTVLIRDTLMGGNGGLGEFWMDAARDKIATIAGREWINRISMGGADPLRDLSGLPSVKVSGENIGDVHRYFDQRVLVVRGRAPRSGTVSIEVSARRRDGVLRTLSFSVAGLPLNAFESPDVIYPNVDYVVDPKLPNIEGARAVVRDGDRIIAAVTEGSLRFKATPRDTGRTFVIERSVDGTAEAPARSVLVRSFGVPIIRDVKKDADSRKRTVVVQFFSADRSVNRPVLKVLDGNATEPRKLSGFLRPADGQRPTTSWLEVFEVTQRDASRPFTFRIQAFDDRGRASSVWIED